MDETMKRLTAHHVNKSLGAYMVCSMACIDDDFDCNNCEKLAEMVDRLAAYEDAMPLERAQELAQAEKDGRLVVLPPVSEDANAFQQNLDVFELFLAIKWANAAALMDKKPEVSHLFHLSEIALNEKLERLVNGQSSRDPLPCEEAEAALKKREDD